LRLRSLALSGEKAFNRKERKGRQEHQTQPRPVPA
jgi:hypothetical protein